MIYPGDSWLGLIFRVRGTVIPRVWLPVLLNSLYTFFAYKWCIDNDVNLGETRGNVLGSILSFLLVFRANNAYARYSEGSDYLLSFFNILTQLVSNSICCMNGGTRTQAWRWRRRWRWRGAAAEQPPELPEADRLDTAASADRTHIIRWALVTAISLQMHLRVLRGLSTGHIGIESQWLVQWDRYRIRHLTNSDEFAELDCHIRALTVDQSIWDEAPMEHLDCPFDFEFGPPQFWGFVGRVAYFLCRGTWKSTPTNMAPLLRLPVVAVYHLICAIGRSAGSRPHGFSERSSFMLFDMAGRLLEDYVYISQIVALPLPFPYFHMCKVVLVLYFAMFPFFIERELGFWANVGELCCLSFALLGVDAIATELEDPYGDDTNDLDVFEKIFCLEADIMNQLDLAGDACCRSGFVWVRLPTYIAKRSRFPISQFLALKAQIDSGGFSRSLFSSVPPVYQADDSTHNSAASLLDDSNSESETESIAEL
mmetsp:Transcript_70057/g.194695  ORF Transcript_70057/g.194695 Transcript_70057/m.194695 type:complete len:482 (-) Transcript_70057:131-1576(-)